MAADLPDVLADLVEAACYVYCADQFTPRDSPQMTRLGEHWRRRFRFVIPVRRPEIWSRPEVVSALTSGLGFLSDDAYTFRFLKKEDPTGLQPHLEFAQDGPPSGFRPDDVCLFSGGLDSLAGAAEALLEGRRVALVSHQASTMIASRQNDLVAALRTRVPGQRLFHVGVRVTKGKTEAADFTQRTRSFLFAALGFAIARMFHRSELTLFENSVLSINLPVARHVIGSRATRTTHPRVLSDFGRLFTLLAEDKVTIRNPFFWDTKTEVVQRLAKGGCADLIARSFSCTRVREATQSGKHCGRCSQCVDRRFAVLAAGLDAAEAADAYEIDLLKGARPRDRDLTLVESFVLSAERFAGLSGVAFSSRYGEVFRALPYLEGPPDQNLERLRDLHARHGAAVIGVLDDQLRSLPVSQRWMLPPTSLLALVQSNVGETAPEVDLVELEPGASDQASRMEIKPVGRPIRFAVDEAGRRVVFAPGVELRRSSFKLVMALLPAFREGRQAGYTPAKFRFMRAEGLAETLEVEEHSMRQNVRRTRERLAFLFRERCGTTLDPQDVVESPGWSGYRLNPFLEERSLDFILSEDSAQPRTSQRSRAGVTNPRRAS
jgi:hypothetical protein